MKDTADHDASWRREEPHIVPKSLVSDLSFSTGRIRYMLSHRREQHSGCSSVLSLVECLPGMLGDLGEHQMIQPDESVAQLV